MNRGQDKYAAAAAETWEMLAGIIQAAPMIPSTQRAAPGSLPLTVIGGFLGAGKTTLLNRLLSAPDGRKIAVLVNDFGRINIDSESIQPRAPCCTTSTGQAANLRMRSVTEPNRKRASPDPLRIAITIKEI